MNTSIVASMITAVMLALSASMSFADMDRERTPSDPNVAAAKKAIDAKNWKAAIESLNKAKPSADVYNYLGYANRNLGNYDEAFKHYHRALELDSRHRGAHEYIGEAYLLTKNLAKAEEHLAALNKICGTRCEEYRDLAREVAAYKKKNP